MRPRTAVLAVLLLAAACGQQSASADMDAARAWIDGYLDAVGTRVDAAASYVADEVSVEGDVVGRARYLEIGRDWCGDSCEEITAGARYVGESGAVLVHSFEGEWLGETYVHPFLTHLTIGADGIEAREDRDATALLSHNPYGGAGRRACPDALPGEDIAAAALDSWSDGGWSLDRAGDHHVAGSTYDPDAPAVYVGLDGQFGDQISEVWMLVSHRSACPDRMAVRLTIDDEGSVEREDRYPGIEALRACPQQAPGGWLEGCDAPVPLRERVTGSVSVADSVIEVCHGTDDMEAGIRWAMDRFAKMGLSAPPVTSVAFDPYAPSCDDSLALSTFTGATTDVLVCGDAESLCDEDGCLVDSFSRRILLHEFAHAWLNAYVDEATEGGFVALMGLSTWDDTGEPWARRGIEWAAETLAWGLHDHPVGMFAFGDPSCETLTDGFRWLTGVESSSTCG